MKIILAGRLIQAAIAFITLRVATTLLSPEEMGRVGMLIALLTFFSMVFVNPVGMFINRRLHGWVRNAVVSPYLKLYIIYLVITALGGIILVRLISNHIQLIPGISFPFLSIILGFSIIFGTLNQTYIPSLNLLGHPVKFVALTIITLLSGLCISVLLVTTIDATAQIWHLGQVLGQSVVAIFAAHIFYQFAYSRHEGKIANKEPISFVKIKSLFLFSWPLSFAVFLTWIQNQSFRFIVPDIIGMEELGYFVVGYGVAASFIGIFESVFSAWLIPNFYQQVALEDRNKTKQAWLNYANAVLPSLCIVTAVIALTSDELAKLLLGQKFHEVGIYILWGALAESMRVALMIYSLAAHAHMNTKVLLIPNLFGALIAPTLIVAFLPLMGTSGIGLGLANGGLIAVIVCAILMNRRYAIHTPWHGIAKASAIVLGLLVLSHLMLPIYHDDLFTAIIRVLVQGFAMLAGMYFLLRPLLNLEANP